jgi:hypothetical protein
LIAAIAVAVLSHLFMDWQGSYGWRPFLPWRETWYYLDWVAIVDPFFWLVPLVALAWGANRHWLPLSGTLLLGGTMTVVIALAAEIVAPWVLVAYGVLGIVAGIGWIRYWVGPVHRQRAAACALLVLAAYAGAQGVVGQRRKREIHDAATRRFGPRATWAALTDVGQPFTWEAVYAGADTVAGDDWRLPRHLRAPEVVRALRESKDGRAMAQFARFLTAEVDSGGKVIYVRDARYARGGRGGWGVMRIRTE